MRVGTTCADGAGEDAGEVAVTPTLGEEFFGGAGEPAIAVTILKTLFE